MHNYTTYLVANQKIEMQATAVEGPRIGICTTELTMVDSKIEASGHGCVSDEGLGHGE